MTDHTFGGSALDRHLYDFETSADGMAETSGAPAGEVPSPEAAAEPPVGAHNGEPDPSTGATDTTPAWTPDNPVFLETVDQRAAEIAHAQVQPILGLLQNLAQPGSGQTAAPQFDWQNVNALEDDFGPQLAQGISSTVQQALAPVYEFMQQMQQSQQTYAQQQQEAGITEAVNDWIGKNASDLPDTAKSMIRPLAQHFMPEFEAIYGQQAPRAGEAAFRKALETVKDIRGPQPQSTEHLAAVAAARTDLAGAGSGSGVVTFPDQPRSARERVAAYAPQLQGAHTT